MATLGWESAPAVNRDANSERRTITDRHRLWFHSLLSIYAACLRMPSFIAAFTF